jgi:hypothetical protein
MLRLGGRGLGTKVDDSMTNVTAPCLLCIGLSVPPDGPDGTYVHADTARRGLELIKLLQFDLVVVAPGEIGMSVPQFVRQMRVVAPWLKWVLASTRTSDPVTTQDELAARCNGALAVIDEIESFDELLTLASSVRMRSRRPVPLEA